MRLTEIKRDGWTVVRDGSFSSLGLCGAAAGLPILTFAGNEKFLRIRGEAASGSTSKTSRHVPMIDETSFDNIMGYIEHAR